MEPISYQDHMSDASTFGASICHDCALLVTCIIGAQADKERVVLTKAMWSEAASGLPLAEAHPLRCYVCRRFSGWKEIGISKHTGLSPQIVQPLHLSLQATMAGKSSWLNKGEPIRWLEVFETMRE